MTVADLIRDLQAMPNQHAPVRVVLSEVYIMSEDGEYHENLHPTMDALEADEVRNERHVYASREQMLQLARAADRPDVRAMIRVAFYSGMRLGELMRVEVAGGALHLADTKNGDRRSIPAHTRITTCLRYLPLTAEKRTLQAAWARARKACGMEHLHLHDLRHSAASEMINADVDLFTVGAVLGHKDPRSTKRYAHLKHDTLAAAVGKIGRKSPHTPQQKDRPKAA